MIARDFLSPDDGKAPRTELVVHGEVQTLVAHEPGRCETDGGLGLCVETVRRLACDCGLRLDLEGLGRTFDVGRRTRKISPALRRKVLEAADRHCQFPGCRSRRRLHVHHVRHWLDGGESDYENLVALCHFHHRAVHEGRWQLLLDHDRIVVCVDPRGRPVRDTLPTLPSTEPGVVSRVYACEDVDPDLRGCMSQWDAVETFDLHWTVDTMCQDLDG